MSDSTGEYTDDHGYELIGLSLDREFTEWAWYSDLPTRVAFIHILFRALNEHDLYGGKKRGEWTCHDSKCHEIGITQPQFRRALRNLEKTGHITIQKIRYGRTVCKRITVANYDMYLHWGL